MGRGAEQPHQRIMALAAYIRARREKGVGRDEIARDVPGYSGLDDEALRKQLQRDREALRDELGIDITWSDADQHYTIAPTVFTEEEWRVLLAATGAVAVRGIEAETGAGVGAEVVIGFDPLLSELRDAIAGRQAIAFRYLGESRNLQPYILGMWRNRWYVHGFDPDRAATRNFRLDRFETAGTEPAITPVGEPEAYAVPTGLDPSTVLRMDPNAWGTDPPLTAFVRVEPEAVPSFLDEFAEAEEWQRTLTATSFRIEVRHYDSFLIRLLGLGTTVRLLEPDPLVRRLREWLGPVAEAG
ncbi:MAG: helix-turn-helix transcriptional regulator [Actinomycetota bacterium]